MKKTALISIFVILVAFTLIVLFWVGTIAPQSLTPEPFRTDSFCGDFFNLAFDSGKTFNDQAEVIDYLANGLSKEIETRNFDTFKHTTLSYINQQAKDGSITRDNLVFSTFNEFKKEYQNGTSCGLNLIEGTNFDQDHIYFIVGNRWFVSQDGKIIGYYATEG